MLSYKAGKSEALIRLRGKQAKAVHATLVFDEAGVVQLPLPGGRLQPLRLVAAYKDMGGQVLV